jgi:protein TonB
MNSPVSFSILLSPAMPSKVVPITEKYQSVRLMFALVIVLCLCFLFALYLLAIEKPVAPPKATLIDVSLVTLPKPIVAPPALTPAPAPPKVTPVKAPPPVKPQVKPETKPKPLPKVKPIAKPQPIVDSKPAEPAPIVNTPPPSSAVASVPSHSVTQQEEKPRPVVANVGKANTKATCISCPHASYPALAKRRQWEGDGRLHLQINAEGMVTQVSVTQSTGYDVLDEAAVDKAKQWRFIEGTAGRTADLPFSFHTTEEE